MALFYNFKGYERLSDDFAVSCDETSVDVLRCNVSAAPINQVWPGYERPIEQTEYTWFANIESNEAVTLKITPKASFESVTVRPLSKKIVPTINEKTVIITFPGAGQYSVEFDGVHHVLTVFINPQKDFGINEGDKNVIYFGAGVHKIDDMLSLEDNQTVYLDRGAVVYGGFNANGKKNISVIGYGIIDNSLNGRGRNPIAFSHCKNATVEGVIAIDSGGWNMHFAGCENVIVDNIKLIGMWRYNSDGCDFTNCTNSCLRNSYLRNYDDCVVIKGLGGNKHLPVSNVYVENCVLWCDWGRGLEIGAETSSPSFSNVTFKNTDIIHGNWVMMDVQHGDRADISDITFENIRCEYEAKQMAPILQSYRGEMYKNPDENFLCPLMVVITKKNNYSVDDKVGNVSRVVFKDIQILSESGRMPPSSFDANAEGTVIDGITLQNIIFNGKKIDSLEALNASVNGDVRNIKFVD